MSRSDLSIHELTPEHRDWNEYVDLIDGEGQRRGRSTRTSNRFRATTFWRDREGDIVGFLTYVVWDIGPHDRNHPPLVVDGQTLREAKIVAFGVKEAYRRQGIGRALQEHAIRRARELGCYQVRSVSGADHSANRQLKLDMGFAVEPMERDKPTLAFVMPTQTPVAERSYSVTAIVV